MLINCPKCKSVYEIPADEIYENGRKMLCSNCGKKFVCHGKDALVEQFVDLENIVPEYIVKYTKELIERGEDGKRDAKKSKGIVISLASMLLCFFVLFLFFMRYDIVRYMPIMEKVYSSVGLESIYRGRNLEFINIKRSEYVEDNVSKMQITGEIYNAGKYTVIVPNINLQIIDKNSNIVLFEEHKIDLNRLEADNTLSFKIITINPTPFAKSVYLTFAEK